MTYSEIWKALKPGSPSQLWRNAGSLFHRIARRDSSPVSAVLAFLAVSYTCRFEAKLLPKLYVGDKSWYTLTKHPTGFETRGGIEERAK